MRNRDLVVIDEADVLEDILLQFIQVSISPKQVETYALPKPDKKTVQESWVEWCGVCYDSLSEQCKEIKRTIPEFPSVVEIRALKSISTLVADFARLTDAVNGLGSGNWVYDGYRENYINFKPISVAPYAHQYLWQHGYKWLLMSATIISADELARSLGL